MPTNRNRTALEAAAKALGYKNPEQASNQELHDYLGAQSGIQHRPEGGGNAPQGKGVRRKRDTGGEAAGSFGVRAATFAQLQDNESIVLSDGDLIILTHNDRLVRVNIDQGEDGTRVTSLLDGNGDLVEYAPEQFRPNKEYVNTGVHLGDLLRTEETPYFVLNNFDSDRHTLQGANRSGLIHWNRDGRDGDLMSFGPRKAYGNADRSITTSLADVTGHWPLRDGRQIEVTQEGVNHLARINALTNGTPLTISDEPVLIISGVGHPNGCAALNVDVEEDNPAFGVSADYDGPPGILGNGVHFVTGRLEDVASDLINALGQNISENKRGYDASNLSRIMANLPLDMTEPIYEVMECDSTSLRDPNAQPFDPSRATLADLKKTQPPQKRTPQVVPDDKVRQLVDEAMGDSDKVRDALTAALEGNREAFREALGVPQDLDTLGQRMIDDVEEAFAKLRDEQEVWRERTEAKMTRTIEFRQPDLPTIQVENAHERMPSLLFNAKLRLHTLLVGPSGAGKTTASRMIADALGLPFGAIALGPTQTETKFSGYTDAHGVYVPTEFYRCFRYGGVFLMDEFDAGHPGALTWINAALANGVASFPRGVMGEWERQTYHPDETPGVVTGGMIEAHPDFVAIASANTFGKGADMVYQGRNALDGATLKRFKVIYWDYDERLERALAGDDVWVDFVQAVRASAQHLDMHHIVSPVDAIDGAKMIQAGKPWNVVAHETLLAGLTQADRTKLLNPQGAPAVKRAIGRAHQALTQRETSEEHLGAFTEGGHA